jgi:hypothetical protein
MSDVKRGDGVSLLNRRTSDEQVVSRKRDALGRLPSANLPGDFRRAFSIGWTETCFFSSDRGRYRDLDLAERPRFEPQEIFSGLSFRFASMMMLEPRISPRTGNSMTGCAP